MDFDDQKIWHNVDDLISRGRKDWPDSYHIIRPDEVLLNSYQDFVDVMSSSGLFIGVMDNFLKRKPMPWNRFIFHMMVMAVASGEAWQRIIPNIECLFPDRTLKDQNGNVAWTFRSEYFPGWKKTQKEYCLSPQALVDGVAKKKKAKLEDLILFFDLAAILFFGKDTVPTCDDMCNFDLGRYIGNQQKFESEFGPRCYKNSPMLRGSVATQRGNQTEESLRRYLLNRLDCNIFTVSQKAKKARPCYEGVKADVLIYSAKHPGMLYFIASSFQVTGNSTFEIKANAAPEHFRICNEYGFRFVNLIGGFGNFARLNALYTLMKYSHDCFTVSDPEEIEFEKIAQDIESYFGQHGQNSNGREFTSLEREGDSTEHDRRFAQELAFV